MNNVTLSSKQHVWKTPNYILEIINRLGYKNKNGIRVINLDPCASKLEDYWFATHNITKKQDGLQESWSKFGPGLVYVNPPYGRKLPKWIAKASSEKDCEIVLLCPARPGNRWWRNAWSTIDAYCFFNGRIKFMGAKDQAPFPSIFFYWGKNPYKFCHVFSRYGIVGILRNRIM
jgi:site-specific DNA-methyltransferase (adenine-specific)